MVEIRPHAMVQLKHAALVVFHRKGDSPGDVKELFRRLHARVDEIEASERSWNDAKTRSKAGG